MKSAQRFTGLDFERYVGADIHLMMHSLVYEPFQRAKGRSAYRPGTNLHPVPIPETRLTKNILSSSLNGPT